MAQQAPDDVSITGGSITGVSFASNNVNITGGSITGVSFASNNVNITGGNAFGITGKTSSRTSTSTVLALEAAAMNAHRTSSDHDNRYGAVQQQLGIELGRDYNSGSMINIYRIGRQVTIWWDSALFFPDQFNIRSNNILPAWALPGTTQVNFITDVRYVSTGGDPGTISLIQKVRVTDIGEFQVSQDKTETSTTCFPSAVTYIVPE